MYLVSALSYYLLPGRSQGTEKIADRGPCAWGQECAWEPWTVRDQGMGAPSSPHFRSPLCGWATQGPETRDILKAELDSAPASQTPQLASFLPPLHS